MVYRPDAPAPRDGYPVLTVLDANWYFDPIADAAQRAMDRKAIEPCIVVGVGYPTDDQDELSRRRDFDLTTPVTNTPAENSNPRGGADAFLRVLEQELKPFVAARYPVDPARTALYGHSFGGFAVLHELFRNPGAFSTYIISSPAIWWQQKSVLADEAAFAEQARAGKIHANVVILSGGEEQPGTPSGAQYTMLDDPTGLATRLAGLNRRQVPVSRIIYPGLSHDSLPFASAGLVVQFAIPQP
jgi:predicted alpha/beta superfamily hydrolase